MKATVTLDHDMVFQGSGHGGFSIQMDSSPAVGGDDSGLRPMELLLLGLGGCTAMDVISILRKKRQDITGFEVQLEAKQANEHPRIFTYIKVNYLVHGRNLKPEAIERAIELSETKYCPAQAMLSMVTTIEHSYEIVEVE